ncbi:MAG: hypothetical protein G3I10_07410 [Ferrovum sp.]|nr:hypothetical protein [Ferrovum sp.]
MAFTNPTTPNLADFASYVTEQGVPSADLPTGTLTGVSVDTSGNLTATGFTGTVAVGMVLTGSGISAPLYLATWNGTNAGTVTPAPAQALSITTATLLSPYLQWAFDAGVNLTLIPPADMPAILYVMACYQLAMHQLLKMAQDQTGQTFFTQQRTTYGLLSFSAGPVISSGDQGTHQTLAEPEFLKGLTVSTLDLLKTPWGRESMAYSQQYGENIVGVS